jgi:hypothetical protein
VIAGTCTLAGGADGGTLVFEVAECAGTQSMCEGTWRIIGATGRFGGLSGSGTLVGHLTAPSPLPWLWSGPLAGYNDLTGNITLP